MEQKNENIKRESAELQTNTSQSLCVSQLVKYSPVQLPKTYATVRSMKDCVALPPEQNPTLLKLANAEGMRQSTVAMVALNIAALDEFLGLNNRLTDQQLDFIAEEVVDTYGGALTFADVMMVSKNAKMGMYGKLYERLSAPEVLGWFKAYYEERLDMAEQYSYKKDKRTFGITKGKEGTEVLRGLGYKMEGGKLTYDHETLARNSAPKEEQTETDYQKYKQQLINNNFKFTQQ